MRNRKFIYAALALLILGFTACQQEDDFTPQGGVDGQEIRINFTTDAIQTRVNTLGTGDVWENGDQVKIEKTVGDTREYYTYTVSVDENGTPTWTPDKKLCWDGKEVHRLAAFYPAAGQDDYTSFVLPDDQRTEAKLKSADCMNAIWEGYPTADAITFQMKHRLSMVTIKYEFASEFTDATIRDVRVWASAPVVLFLLDGEIEDFTETFDGMIWAYHNEINKTIQAIVIPCTYPKGQLFMEFNVGLEELHVKMPEAKTLNEGTHYTFDLKVGKDKVKLTPTGTSPDFPGGWDDDSEVNLN